MKAIKLFAAILVIAFLLSACAPTGPTGSLVLFHRGFYGSQTDIPQLATVSLDSGKNVTQQLPDGILQQSMDPWGLNLFVSPDGSEIVGFTYSHNSDGQGLILNIWENGKNYKNNRIEVPEDVLVDTIPAVVWKEGKSYILIVGFNVETPNVVFPQQGSIYVYRTNEKSPQFVSKLNFSLLNDSPTPGGLSQDGKEILIISQGNLTIATTDGEIRITNDGSVQHAIWGKYGVIFQTVINHKSDAEYCLNVYNPDTRKITSNIVCVTGPKINYGPPCNINLSPNDSKIAFVCSFSGIGDYGSDSLIIQSMENPNITLFRTNKIQSIAELTWSPDEKWLAFVQATKVNADNTSYYKASGYIMPADGSSPPKFLYAVDEVFDGSSNNLIGWLR